MDNNNAITYASARWNGRAVIVEIRKGEDKEVFTAQVKDSKTNDRE